MPGARPKPLIGIALMICAMLVMPFLDVVAKFLGQQNVPIIEIVWGRLAFGTLMTAPLVVSSEGIRGLVPQQPLLHLARAGLVAVATALFFWALKYQGIAETLAIYFVQPLVVTMLSPAILGEKVGLRRWLAVIVGFMGTLVIIRPGFQNVNPGMLMALGAGTCSGIYMLISRILAGQNRATASTFHTSLAGAVLVSIVVFFFWQEPTLQQWFMFTLLAFFATLGNYLAIRALEYAEASLLAPFGYAEMINAVAAGWYFFGDFPDGWTFAGVGILIVCAIYISYRERGKKTLPPYQTPEIAL
jgi:drug/metabolite transporter (DMT)-like permease